MSEEKKKPFYGRGWFVVIMLILFFPIGLALMWVASDWSKKAKWWVTGIVGFFLILTLFDESEDVESEEEIKVEEVGEDKDEVNKESTEHTEEEEVTKEDEEADEIAREEEERLEKEREDKIEREEEERLEKEQEDKLAREEEERLEKERLEKEKEDLEKQEIKEEELRGEIALGILENSFEGIAIVGFERESKIYTITPIDPMFSVGVVTAYQSGQGMEEWNYLKESLKTLSEKIKKEVGRGYSLAIVNPESPDKYILIVTEGEEVYSIMNE